MNNSGDSVFKNISARPGEADLVRQFLAAHDFSDHTVRAFTNDIRKFASWFSNANSETFEATRITVRDIADFKRHLRQDRGQAVSTVNRCLVALRRYLEWLVASGRLPANPAKGVKELRRQQLAPQGLERSQVRRLLREVDLRGDIRANAIFHLFLFTGCRVSDLVQLENHDLVMTERNGSVTFRFGKHGKQRTVPLPLQARRALQAYLDSRPPVQSTKLFIGERGPLSERGIRALCRRYSAITGFRIYPHLLRHTMAHQFLNDSQNDVVALAQLLGHENLNTTARYTQRTPDALAHAAEQMNY